MAHRDPGWKHPHPQSRYNGWLDGQTCSKGQLEPNGGCHCCQAFEWAVGVHPTLIGSYRDAGCYQAQRNSMVSRRSPTDLMALNGTLKSVLRSPIVRFAHSWSAGQVALGSRKAIQTAAQPLNYAGNWRSVLPRKV